MGERRVATTGGAHLPDILTALAGVGAVELASRAVNQGGSIRRPEGFVAVRARCSDRSQRFETAAIAAHRPDIVGVVGVDRVATADVEGSFEGDTLAVRRPLNRVVFYCRGELGQRQKTA